jgi:predicted thioesterase
MLEPGRQATVEEAVTEDMTADRLGSGDVPVLGTPAVLALVEAAAVAAVADALEPGTTPVGATVTATAALAEVEGRRLTFRFEVTDAAGPVARGEHVRVVVDRERFLGSAAERAGTKPQPR